MILANDFLSIVENDGVWILWRDLAKVTPDRIGIYRAMADLLQQLKRTNEYMEVLQIIHLHQPEDFETALKLARLYRDDKKYGSCLSVLESFAGDTGNLKDTHSYYLLKAECEKKTGDDDAFLKTWVAYLREFPDDHAARLKGVRLAGDLGRILVMGSLAQKSVQKAQNAGKVEPIFLVYLDGLLKNRHLEKATRLLESVLDAGQYSDSLWLTLTGKKVEILKMQGRLFEMEQILRTAFCYCTGQH